MADISEDVIRLAAGTLALELVPGIGGSTAAFRLDGIDIFRPLSAENFKRGNVLGVGSFPMVPYANRIAGNAFNFDGRTYRFEANNPPEVYNVHGTGWHRPWMVEDVTAQTARLSLVVEEPERFSYRAEQLFQLDATGLSLVTRVTNLGARRMPFGLGHHPWFPRDPDVVVGFRARSFHLNEPEMVIGERVSLPPEVAFDPPRGLPNRWRCSDYGGWDGEATIVFPGRGVGLRIEGDEAYRHLMVYADPTQPVFCIEPQTNASGAFNRAGAFTDPEEGLTLLGPGESLVATLRFRPYRL